MKGNNELTMNQATMCAAVTYYLNNVVMKVAVKVESVDKNTKSYGQEDFIVKLAEIDPDPEKETA